MQQLFCPWLVEAVDDSEPDLTTLRRSCIADGAQGEQIEVFMTGVLASRLGVMLENYTED